MTAAAILPLLLCQTVFRFEGGTVFDLARKLDDGKGVVISLNSSSKAKLKAFEFKFDDQKDFDRLLMVKSGIRRLGQGAYAARGYPLHIMDPPAFKIEKGRGSQQLFAWNSKWPIKDVDEKWVVKNEKDEPYRLGLFPNGLGGKSLKMPPFFDRLEVIVTSGTYEPKSLANKIASSLGAKLKVEEDVFEVIPNLTEVRRRFKETFDEKLSLLQSNDVRTQYDFASVEYSREMFSVAPNWAIESLLRNENSSDFTIPLNANLQAVIRKRALAYSRLPNMAGLSPSMPLQPSNLLESTDWDRPMMAGLYSWPLRAGLMVWMKGKDAGMAF